jgi:hypothetical protein
MQMTSLRSDGVASKTWSIEVKIVRTPDEFAMASAIRAAVFLGEEDNLTYGEEFSGNDYVATYFLVMVDGDPAGVIRARWFNGFAMLERVAIRKRYRSYRVFAALARASIEHVRQKGYKIVAGRARGDTLKLWQRFSGHQSGEPVVNHRGVLYPVLLDVPYRPDLGHIETGPFGDPDYEERLFQIEGSWNFDQGFVPHAVAAE